MYDFPYDEPFVPEGDKKFDLLEVRFRELGRQFCDRVLYLTLFDFDFQEPTWDLAVELLKMACERTPKGKIAKILRKQNESKFVFHRGNSLVPDFDRGGSKTIAYGVFKVLWYLKREVLRTLPMTRTQLAMHAGENSETIRN